MKTINKDPKFTPEEFEKVYNLAIKSMEFLLNKGLDVILDASLCTQKSRKKVLDFISRRKDLEVFIIQLKADPKIIRKRVEETYKTHPDKDVTPEIGFILAKNYQDFQNSINTEFRGVKTRGNIKEAHRNGNIIDPNHSTMYFTLPVSSF